MLVFHITSICLIHVQAAIEADLERRRRELEVLESQRLAEAIRLAQEASLKEPQQSGAAKTATAATGGGEGKQQMEAAAERQRKVDAETAALASLHVQVDADPVPAVAASQAKGKAGKSKGKGANATEPSGLLPGSSPSKLQHQPNTPPTEQSSPPGQKRNTRRTTLDGEQTESAAPGKQSQTTGVNKQQRQVAKNAGDGTAKPSPSSPRAGPGAGQPFYYPPPPPPPPPARNTAQASDTSGVKVAPAGAVKSAGKPPHSAASSTQQQNIQASSVSATAPIQPKSASQQSPPHAAPSHQQQQPPSHWGASRPSSTSPPQEGPALIQQTHQTLASPYGAQMPPSHFSLDTSGDVPLAGLPSTMPWHSPAMDRSGAAWSPGGMGIHLQPAASPPPHQGAAAGRLASPILTPRPAVDAGLQSSGFTTPALLSPTRADHMNSPGSVMQVCLHIKCATMSQIQLSDKIFIDISFVSRRFYRSLHHPES